jgi:hypothetical protein
MLSVLVLEVSSADIASSTLFAPAAAPASSKHQIIPISAILITDDSNGSATTIEVLS